MAQNKLKTSRSLAKRIKKTGGGRIKRMKAGKSHLLTGKSRKHKRRLRESTLIDPTLVSMVKRLAPYL